MSEPVLPLEHRARRRESRLRESLFAWRNGVAQDPSQAPSPSCAALIAAFRHLRRPVAPLAEVADARSVREAVDRLGFAHGVLVREVTLSPDWWRYRGEPLVVEHPELGPCFVCHRRGRWVGERRSATGEVESVPIDAAFGTACEEAAHEFIPAPFPGALRIRDLLATAMSGRWGDLGIRLAAACIAASVGVVLPLMTALVIDSVIPNGDVRGLVGVAAALVVAVVATTLLLFIAGQATLRLDNSLAYRIEAMVLARELRRAQSTSALSAGEIVQRVTGVNFAMTQLTAATNTVLVQMVGGFANIAVLFFFSWVFGIIGLLAVGLTISMMVIDLLIQRRYSLASENAFGRTKATSIRILEGLESAKDRGLLDRLIERWQGHSLEAASNNYRSNSVSNARTLVNQLISSSCRVLMYGLAAYALVDGLTIGAFVASMAAFASVMIAVGQLGSLVGTIAHVEPIFARLRPLLEAPAAVARGAYSFQPSGAYRVADALLVPADEVGAARLSVEIAPEQLTVIVSERVSMAQRLLGMLTGLEPSEGRVLIDDTPVEQLGIRGLQPHLNSLVTVPGILPGTVRRNLDPTRRFDDETLLAALPDTDWLGLKAGESPLDATLDPRNVPEFASTGLAAARLVIDPRRVSVIVDHAAMQRSSNHRDVVTEIAARPGTRILASNAPDLVGMADRVIVLDQRGRIVADGAPADVASSEAIPAKLRGAFA
jgi:ABC-type multidrug transport system fused ATPase/permease subunit